MGNIMQVASMHIMIQDTKVTSSSNIQKTFELSVSKDQNLLSD